MTIEDTIYQYYEAMLQGQMEKSQELLDWDNKEASLIDYYANIRKLHKEYHLVSLEDLEIMTLFEKDGIGNADVKMTYLDKNGIERIEINKVNFRVDSKDTWKITSIKIE
ncbi:hypothetical protein [Paenibacillus montanisoli]|uniref:NTF2 fold immunity protein domain-containing protein n=1 Tax=Paenibacillus montanisoli TaxID=2081970 RepID=A0A328U3D0_9BACL|nr:hypothetical protein [Paenibacillus montanisoli]RAP77318.1 hypothetical protein DL346_02140 [Paenibacillus montanisoli]